jgi:hypothetical protein
VSLVGISPADWLVIAVAFQYALAAVLYASSKQWPLVVMFAGYAFSNVGIVWAAIRLRHG